MNVSNLISQHAYVFILATGMLLCILTGGNIDLSVGSVVCFVGAIGALLMVNVGAPVWLTILIMILIGTAIGAFQGFWIAFVRIPPFITTLAGMLAFRGLSNVVLNGLTVSIKDETTFVNLFGGGADCYVHDVLGGNGINLTCLVCGILAAALFVILQFVTRVNRKKHGYDTEPLWTFVVKMVVIVGVVILFAYKLAQHKGIPTVLIWVLVVVLVYGYITQNTTVGRHFYAVGGNEKATKLSGINTNKVYFLAYTNMGFLAALAAMVTIARLTSAQPTYGQNYEMDAIGSCFIGGASAYGGIGTVPGVIVGAVLMGVINLGMSLMGVDANMQKVVKGAVLLAAVIFDVVSKRGGKMIVKN
jgi:putative multiple sugar transport system permease protein